MVDVKAGLLVTCQMAFGVGAQRLFRERRVRGVVERDDEGRCIAVNVCTDDDGDCLAPDRPRAWSSPIYVDHPSRQRSR